MFRTAQRRLVAWNVLVLSLILTVLGLSVYSLYSSHVYSGVDQQLRNQAGRIEQFLIRNNGNLNLLLFPGSNVFDPISRTVVANPLGQINGSTDCLAGMSISSDCPSDSFDPASSDGLRAAVTNGIDLRTGAFQGQPQRVLTYTFVVNGKVQAIFQTSRLASGEEAGLHELRRLLILGGLLGIILSALGSFFLATRALIPIREAFRRQRQFTADASHELRTPLALIRATAEMLARHTDRFPGGDGELIGQIISETDRLNRLVGDLLTLARADARQLNLTVKPLDLRTLVSNVHEDLERIAASRGVESQVSLDGPVMVEGDEMRLRQLLLILLDNALKYTDPGGKVDVVLSREDGRAHLLVADTGIGIPSHDLPHIFDRFYRVDRARERESGGTGLGLAIAQWIAQAHQGSIKVTSEVGRGTRFQVDLPAKQGKPPQGHV